MTSVSLPPCLQLLPDHKEILFPDGLHTIKSGEADVRSTADPAAFAPPGWADPQSLS